MLDAESHQSLLRSRRLFCGALLIVAAFRAHCAVAPNDDFTNATVITQIGNIIVATNVDAGPEPGEPLHAGSVGGRSLWWSWQSPFTGSAYISTGGSSFDTLLAVYTGETITNLEWVADNDDPGGFGDVTSYLVFRAIAGETYQIAVDGFEGATGRLQLSIGHVGSPAPIWALEDLYGTTIYSTDFTNKVLVIDFWETTCGACVDELPYLIQIYTNFVPEGFAFFGISMDPPETDIRAFIGAHQIPYPIARGDAEVDAAFGGNVPFPTKFLIDRENKLVGQYSVGNADYAYYAKRIKPLLRGSKNVPLTIRRGMNGFVFAWPAVEFGYGLETASALGTTNWTSVPYQLVTTNNENTVIAPVSAGTQFFRLRKTSAPQ